MSFEITASGLSTQTQEEIVEELSQKIRSTLGVNINTLPDSVMGQLVNIMSELFAANQQTALAIYRARDPNSAIGVLLDVLANLTGSVRKGSTKSIVNGILTFSAADVVNDGDLIENADTSDQWAAINGPYTAVGPFPEEISATFEAVEPGPLIANAGTTWNILTSIPNLDSFTNPTDDADPGRLQEEDPEFRKRRQIEIFSNNIGPYDAVRGTVSKVDGVDAVQVYDNPNISPVDSDGIPFKAFNVVVETTPDVPGVDLRQRIADAIWSVTGLGGEAYGTDYNETVTDIEGSPQEVGFDLIDKADIYVNITLSTVGTEDPITPIPDSQIEQVVEDAILAAANSRFNNIGQNQLEVDYIGVVEELKRAGEISGITQVTVELSTTALGGPYSDPLEISIRERPNFESVNVEVTVVNL